MKILLACVLVFACVGPSLAIPPSPAGQYRCHGTQGGETYHIALVVTVYREGFRFDWKSTAEAQPMQVGLSVLRGNQMAVAIMSARGDLAVGLYTYTPGRLDGVWSWDGRRETETCVTGVADA